ncbi:hypothetical protein ACWIWK_05300 [Helicobacter sp. 23-1048]
MTRFGLFCKIICITLLCSVVFGVDNSSLQGRNLGKHYKTYGLVYIVPQEAINKIETLSFGLPKHYGI